MFPDKQYMSHDPGSQRCCWSRQSMFVWSPRIHAACLSATYLSTSNITDRACHIISMHQLPGSKVERQDIATLTSMRNITIVCWMHTKLSSSYELKATADALFFQIFRSSLNQKAQDGECLAGNAMKCGIASWPSYHCRFSVRVNLLPVLFQGSLLKIGKLITWLQASAVATDSIKPNLVYWGNTNSVFTFCQGDLNVWFSDCQKVFMKKLYIRNWHTGILSMVGSRKKWAWERYYGFLLIFLFQSS